MDADSIVTISPAGDPIQDKVRGQFFGKHILRSYYWFDRFYNLIEVFEADGTLIEIYINIASPPSIEGMTMSYTDHELDVSKHLPWEARLVDEDEFAEAILEFCYTKEFQQKLLSTAREALDLADRWQAKPAPQFGGQHD